MTALVVVIDVATVALLVHAIANAALLRRPPRGAGVDERVSILIPMRNEAARLTPSLPSVMAQTGLRDVEILVYDDDSTDGTSELVRRLGGDAVQLLPPASLPPGWLGKPHACARLAASAGGTVLVFVDADVVLEPDAVAAAVSLLRSQHWQFVSPYPRQLAVSWLERLVQPLLQWSWLTFLPLGPATRSPRPSRASANGQFLVVDADAYRRAGGHATVHDAIVEDIALARALRSVGACGGFADGHRIARCRMYDGPRAVVDGYAKSLWTAFGTPVAAGVVALLLLGLYVAPWVLLGWTALAWIGVGAGVAGRVVTALRVGDRPADAVLQPLSIIAFAILVAISLVRRQRRTLQWKMRTLP